MRSIRLPFAALGVTFAVTFVLGSSLVLAAPGSPVPVDAPAFADLRAALKALGASDADVQAVAGIASVPGNVEYLNPFGLAATKPVQVDPILTAIVGLKFSNIAVLAGPGGPLAAGPGPLGTVVYGQGLVDPAPGTYYMYAKAFSTPCGPSNATQEYGTLELDTTPLNGGNPEPFTTGTNTNLFYGINTAYVLHADPNLPFHALRYQRSAPGSAQDFVTTDSNWIGICTGDTIIGLIPEDEWSGITQLRFFGYYVPIQADGNPDPAGAGQMRYPGIADNPLTIDETIPERSLGEQVGPTSQPTPTISPSPTVAKTPVPTPAITPTPFPTLPTFPPPQLPSFITPDYLLYLLGIGGVTLVLLAIAIWVIRDRRSWLGVARDCLPLLDAWRRAQEACDEARAAAEAAWQRYLDASKAARAAEAAERDARTALSKAEADLAAAEARAKGEPSGWVEGEPHGRITTDDLALQREANAEVRADADAAKQAQLDAWHAAGSPQGDGWAKVDDALSAIEQAAQAKMAHNNDPANLPELRQKAADKAKAQLDALKGAVDAARKALADATAAKLNAQETESVVGAAAQNAREQADKECAAVDPARRAYEECVGQAQAAAKAKAQSTPPPPPPKTGTSVGPGVVVGPGGNGGGGVGKPKSTPPDRPCHDGDEEWRPEGPARSFVIRDDGPKTRVILWTDPGINGLEQWIGESASADKRDSGEHHPSISVAELDFIPGRLGEWMRGLEKAKQAPPIDMHFEIKVKSRTVQCERRWVCRGSGWQPAETRSTVTDRPMPPQHLDEASVAPTMQKVQGFLGRVKRMVDQLNQGEQDAEKAGQCE